MGVDLTAKLNNKQWNNAITVCQKALNRGYLNDWEESFVRDMIEEWELNGAVMEPTVKQFNSLKLIAMEYDGTV